MNIKSFCSTNPNSSEAVAELKDKLNGFNAKMIIFFASENTYVCEDIAQKMQEAFPDTVVFGCCSISEINDTHSYFNSITAMAFNSAVIDDVHVEVVENLRDGFDLDTTFSKFNSYFNFSINHADYNKYGGIIMVDTLALKEEELLEAIGDRTNIMFVGGTASSVQRLEPSFVFANGKAYDNAALLAVFKCESGFSFIKTQSADVIGPEFKVTKSDIVKRRVYEFDGKPASELLAGALGVKLEDFLGDQDRFRKYLRTNPIGIVINSDIYIRVFQHTDETCVRFANRIFEGQRLSVLQVRDMIPDTKAAVEEKRKELGSISGIIDFRCNLRSLQLEGEGKTDEYGKIFEGIPTIGFSTYGEAFYGFMNYTSAMIVFK
ncbi:MAG: FIST C-terminal domain-containing protein [Clostridiales bacterium]|jgi:hypothetical protein|nr:FIST C-terminal domain-containing protein [Clostridiales bacterium]